MLTNTFRLFEKANAQLEIEKEYFFDLNRFYLMLILYLLNQILFIVSDYFLIILYTKNQINGILFIEW